MTKPFAPAIVLVALFALILTAAITVIAGNIDPPPDAWQNGNPVSTMKSMNQVEPRTMIDSLPFAITNPGSYYVISNLPGPVGDHGITIYTNDVILDLGGFSLTGAAASNSFSGIAVGGAGPYKNITVRNGVIRGWGQSGIDGFVIWDSHFENIKAVANGNDGIQVGANSTVIGCKARANGSRGIYAGRGSKISDCAASANTGVGIKGDPGVGIFSCAATDNGEHGIQVDSSSRVRDCSVRINTQSGIAAAAYCVIQGCIAEQNSGHGIVVVKRSRVVDNICAKNGVGGGNAGIYAQSNGNRIQGNTSSENAYGIITENVPGGNVVIQNIIGGNVGTNFISQSSDYVGSVLTGEGTIQIGRPWANFEK